MGARDGYLAALYYWVGEDRDNRFLRVEWDPPGAQGHVIRPTYRAFQNHLEVAPTHVREVEACYRGPGGRLRRLGAAGPLAPSAVARALIQARKAS